MNPQDQNNPQPQDSNIPPESVTPIANVPIAPQPQSIPLAAPQPVQPVAPEVLPQSPVSPLPQPQTPVYGQSQSGYPGGGSSSKKKPIIIGAIILAVILLASGVAFALMSKDKSDSKNKQAQTTSSSTSSGLSDGSKEESTAKEKSSASTAIEGYVPLEKLCYTIQIPKVNDASEDNHCLFSASFGPEKTTRITVTYAPKYHEDLAANVAEQKKREASNSNLVSEESIKVDGRDGKLLVFKSKGASGTVVAYYLIATDKYKVDGVPVTGFMVIAPLYDRPEAKKVFDDIIASWRWK